MKNTLGQLALGARCVVERLELPRKQALRLMEMGLLPGTRVELVRRAPMGDPILLRVRGYFLSIRTNEANQIAVAAITPAAAPGARAVPERARDEGSVPAEESA